MATRKPTPTNVLDDVLSAGVSQETGLRMMLVPLRKLEDNPYQTRQANDQDHVLNLAQSIVGMTPTLPETKGLQQVPLGRLVRWGDGTPIPTGDYDNPVALRQHLADSEMVVQLAFGHSRRLAFVALAEGPAAVFPSLAGAEQVAFNGATFAPTDYAEMPVILTPLTDKEMWRNAITENAQRKDISAVEEAAALRRAMTEFGMTVEAAARDFGWARSTAANKLRLLELPEDVQQACMDGKISERHARELCRLIGDDKRIAEQFDQVLKKGWSVGQLKSSVDWAADAMKRDEAKAVELAKAEKLLATGWTPPGCNQPLPADRLEPTVASWTAELLTADTPHGCSPDCPCMKLLWLDHGYGNGIALSNETPHVFLACTNRARRKEIVAAAAEDPEAKAAIDERRRVAGEEYERKNAQRLATRERKIEEATRLWHDGLAKLDKQALWSSLAFWRMVAKHMQSYYLEKELKAAVSERDAMDRLLAALFEATRQYDGEIESTIYSPAGVKTMLANIAPSKRKAAAEAEPAPEEDLQAVIDRLQVLSDEAQAAHEAQAQVADEAFGIAAPVAAPMDWTQLPADLVAAGWTLELRRGKWYAAIKVETEEKPIETTGRESIATTVQDAMFLHKSLQIGA